MKNPWKTWWTIWKIDENNATINEHDGHMEKSMNNMEKLMHGEIDEHHGTFDENNGTTMKTMEKKRWKRWNNRWKDWQIDEHNEKSRWRLPQSMKTIEIDDIHRKKQWKPTKNEGPQPADPPQKNPKYIPHPYNVSKLGLDWGRKNLQQPWSSQVSSR